MGRKNKNKKNQQPSDESRVGAPPAVEDIDPHTGAPLGAPLEEAAPIPTNNPATEDVTEAPVADTDTHIAESATATHEEGAETATGTTTVATGETTVVAAHDAGAEDDGGQVEGGVGTAVIYATAEATPCNAAAGGSAEEVVCGDHCAGNPHDLQTPAPLGPSVSTPGHRPGDLEREEAKERAKLRLAHARLESDDFDKQPGHVVGHTGHEHDVATATPQHSNEQGNGNSGANDTAAIDMKDSVLNDPEEAATVGVFDAQAGAAHGSARPTAGVAEATSAEMAVLASPVAHKAKKKAEEKYRSAMNASGSNLGTPLNANASGASFSHRQSTDIAGASLGPGGIPRAPTTPGSAMAAQSPSDKFPAGGADADVDRMSESGRRELSVASFSSAQRGPETPAEHARRERHKAQTYGACQVTLAAAALPDDAENSQGLESSQVKGESTALLMKPLPEDDIATIESEEEHEIENSMSSALPWSFFETMLPHGSVAAAAVNFVTATLGVGTLAIPSAMETSGWLTGSVMLAVCAAATVYSIYILTVLVDHTGYQTYEELAKNLLGSKFEKLTAFLIITFCWGTTIIYVVAMGGILGTLRNAPWFPPAFEGEGGQKLMVTCFWALFMLPLSLPQAINSLRYASAVGTLSSVALVLAIVTHANQHGDLASLDQPVKPFSPTVLMSMPVFCFSFSCQMNTFEIYTELKDRSVGRMAYALSLAMALCAGLYIVAGIAGVWDFGSHVNANIFMNYTDPTKTWYIAAACVAVSFTITMAFPLCAFPTRDALLQLMGYKDAYHAPTSVRVPLCTALAASSLVLGLFFKEIGVLFDLLGGLCSGTLGFIWPALFALRSGVWTVERMGMANVVGAWALLVAGALFSIIGTVGSFRSNLAE